MGFQNSIDANLRFYVISAMAPEVERENSIIWALIVPAQVVCLVSPGEGVMCKMWGILSVTKILENY